MRMRSLALAAGVLACMASLPPAALASTILVDHIGNHDPTIEGWILYNASGGTVSGGTETTPSGLHDYWQVSHPSTTTPGNYYRYNLTSSDLDTDWYITGSIRVVDSRNHAWAWGVPFGILLVRDYYSSWGITLGNNVVGILDSTVQFSRSYNMNTRDDYHQYEIYFHRNSAGYADDTTDVIIDGNLIFANVTRSEVSDISSFNGTLNGVWMGAGSSGAYTIVNYGDITLLDGPPATVPEPATFSLLGLGMIVMIWRGKNRKSGNIP